MSRINFLILNCWSMALCLLVFAGLASQSHAQSSDSSICKTLYGQKKYTRAAQCFYDLARQWEQVKPMTGQSRAKAGGFLRNASLCYRKAAKLESTPHKQAYLRERSMLFIQRILLGKLYENASQKRLATHIKDKLEEAIGYAQVTIVTGSPTATGKISGGYRFAEQTWKGLTKVLKLRPGAYTAVIDFAGKASKVKVLNVKPGQAPMVVQMSLPAVLVARTTPPVRAVPEVRRRTPPAMPAPKSKLVPWVLVGIGGAAVITGAIVMGVAFGTKGGADQQIAALRTQQQSNPSAVTFTDTVAVNDSYNSANTQLAVGIALGGVGVSAALVGVVLLAVN